MKIIFATLAYILIGIIELKPALKNTKQVDINWYIILFMFSYFLSILLLLKANIPSPLKPFSDFITYLLGLKS